MPASDGTPTLHEALAAVGLTSEPSQAFNARDIKNAAGDIVFTGSAGEVWAWLHRGMTPLVRRKVRVRYRFERTTAGKGWSFDVLAADSLVYLGSGWSAGRKRDARDDFEAQCRAKGWEL